MNNSKLSPANIVIAAAAVVMLVFSFFAFYKFGSESRSAWSSETDTLLFPVATLAVLFAVLMGAHVAITAFATGMNLPDRVLGLTWDQIHLVLAVQTVILMVAYLIRAKGGLDFGIGFWFMLIASIGLLVGAILRTREPAGSSGSPPPIV